MYLSYINQLRAVASLLVVYVHCIHGLQWDSSHGNLETARLLKIITNYGTFLFVFIAGFLFQHLLYKYNYRDYLKSRFLLVVMPYLVISIPAILAWTFLFNKSGYGMPLGFYDEPWWYSIGFFYLSGQHMAPLWFIPMICIFYLLHHYSNWLTASPGCTVPCRCCSWSPTIRPAAGTRQ